MYFSSMTRSLVVALLGVGALTASACVNDVGLPACTGNKDCRAGQVCSEGACISASDDLGRCTTDEQCSAGQTCINSRCTASLTDGGPGGDHNGDQDGGQNGVAVVALNPVPGIIDFGSPALGVGIERVVSVSNVGTGVFSLAEVAYDNNTSPEYTWETDLPLPVELAPGDSMDVTLVYTLADGVDDSGKVVFKTTAASCSPECADPTNLVYDVVSEFKGARNLAMAPANHDYGFVPATTLSTPVSLIVSNEGTLSKVLTVSNLEVNGDLTQFTYQLPSMPLFLNPGQSIEIPVVYAPTSPQNHQITFTATANSDSPERVTLSSTFIGTAQPPQALVFDPPELVFPDVPLNQSAQRSSKLKNIGGNAITVTGLALGAQNPVEYQVFGGLNPPFAIPPGGFVDVFVNYTSISGQPSANSVSAPNNQPSGLIPVLPVRGTSFIPPGGPNLDIVQGPDVVGQSNDCLCSAPVPAANTDLTYRALPNGPSCGKPANPACGLEDEGCACNMSNFGQATWQAAGVAEVRGETWVVSEQVLHKTPGADGQFSVRTTLLDDCLAVPQSTEYAANYGCCLIDCERVALGTQACYPYGAFPHCPTDCEFFSSSATSQDCLKRGAVSIRTRVKIDGGPNPAIFREFCTRLERSGASAEVVKLQRQNGFFTIQSISAGTTEVAANVPCP